MPTSPFGTVHAEVGRVIRARFDGISSLAYVVSESKECGIEANSLVRYLFDLGAMAFDNLICNTEIFWIMNNAT